MKSHKRIYVLGRSGSGKTTFAKILSEKLGIKHYELDDLFFESKFDKKRDAEKRDKLFQKLCNRNKWIIEGGYTSWIEDGIKSSDVIILLEVPFHKVAYRIIRRFKDRQKAYNEKWLEVLTLLKYTIKYKAKKNKKGYNKHMNLIKKHKKKLIVLGNNKEINKFLEGLR